MNEATTETATPRGPGRPRNADRAPQHIAASTEREPLRDPVHEKPRTRTRMGRTSVADDPFYIPLDEIPEGSSYEWKRFSVNGLEDPFYIAQMRQQGYEPVDPRRHPNWVPPGFSEPHIIKGGQILMERPIELYEEAVRERSQMSRQQVREAEERLGKASKELSSKDFNGDDKVKAKIQREWNRPMPIEE